MSIFIGNFIQFKAYLNDYVKNKVPLLTKKYKGDICQSCQKNVRESGGHIEAAHKPDRERGVLIKEAFEFAVIERKSDQCTVDLEKFSEKITEIHSNPDNFLWLCHSCHKMLDGKDKMKSEVILKNIERNIRNASLFPPSSVTPLPSQHSKKQTLPHQSGDNLHNKYVIAYVFSYFNGEHRALYPNATFAVACSDAAERLGIKYNTLKNIRDEFDGQQTIDYNKGTRKQKPARAGWWQTESQSIKNFVDEYSKKDENEILMEAQEILRHNAT